MSLLENNNKKVDEYNFEKQRQDALNQFEKLYSKFKENNDMDSKKEETSDNQKNKSNKIKAKFQKRKNKNLMDIFFKDQDKTLIILLIIMLMDNEENFMLIMALIYILI